MGMERYFLLSLSIFQVALAGTEFTIADGSVTCNNGYLKVDSFDIDCGGYCTFGSDVQVSGEGKRSSLLWDRTTISLLTANAIPVEILKELPSDTPSVTVNVQSMYDILSNKEVDVCGCLSSSDGSSSCPSAGIYDLDSFGFSIPGDGEQWYSNYAYLW